MNITVYCGSCEGNNAKYRQAAAAWGEWLAAHHITLVYGGGSSGLMGILADAVLAAGGRVIGIIPVFMMDKENVHQNLTELQLVHTMAERKARMLELGDACIALPGGPGTLDEIAEAIALARLERHRKPCVFFNAGGYYEQVRDLFDHMVQAGFLSETGRDKIHFADSLQDIQTILQQQNKDAAGI